MTNASTHHAFCFTLFTLVALAFGFAFASSLASNPSLRGYHSAPRATAFAPGQEQVNSVMTQEPRLSEPCSAEPGPIQIAL
jgi:hypothetical protein